MGHKFSFCETCDTPRDCDFCDRLDVLTERKTGHWVDVKGNQPDPRWEVRCSLCGCPQDYRHNFCPNCGAKMDYNKTRPYKHGGKVC